MDPVQLFKHHEQCRYNYGKPDLYENAKVCICKSTLVSCKTKYIWTMIDQVLVNCLRGEIPVNVLKPWLIQMARTGKRYPTLDPT